MAANPNLFLTVSSNEVIADALATDNLAALNAIVGAARNTLAAGGIVVFTETYSNAAPATLQQFDDAVSFEQWVQQQNVLRSTLGQSAL